MLGINLVSIFSVATVVVHCVGILTAAHAVMIVQSARGAIAWGVFLITFPWLAIPLYLIFGNNEFLGYAKALQAASKEHHKLISQLIRDSLLYKTDLLCSVVLLFNWILLA